MSQKVKVLSLRDNRPRDPRVKMACCAQEGNLS